MVDRCDHRNLNEEVDFLRGVIPTAENLVVAFWSEIAPRIKPGRLHCVRLYETPRNFAEYFGPDRDRHEQEENDVPSPLRGGLAARASRAATTASSGLPPPTGRACPT